MDEAAEMRARAFTVAAVESVCDMLGEETGKQESAIYAEIKKLRQEIGGLRAEIEILRQHKADKELAGVVSLRSRAS